MNGVTIKLSCYNLKVINFLSHSQEVKIKQSDLRPRREKNYPTFLWLGNLNIEGNRMDNFSFLIEIYVSQLLNNTKALCYIQYLNIFIGIDKQIIILLLIPKKRYEIELRIDLIRRLRGQKVFLRLKFTTQMDYSSIGSSTRIIFIQNVEDDWSELIEELMGAVSGRLPLNR